MNRCKRRILRATEDLREAKKTKISSVIDEASIELDNAIQREGEVTMKVEELLTRDADVIFSRLKTQHNYRYGGIDEVPFMDIMREIAEAELKDIDLID
jgi:hypothetical protein